MKLNKDFIKHDMEDATLVVPVAGADFHGIVRGNSTVGAIVGLLENDITLDGIVDAMCGRFDGDPAVIRRDVEDVVAKLKEIGAIDE